MSPDSPPSQQGALTFPALPCHTFSNHKSLHTSVLPVTKHEHCNMGDAVSLSTGESLLEVDSCSMEQWIYLAEGMGGLSGGTVSLS